MKNRRTLFLPVFCFILTFGILWHVPSYGLSDGHGKGTELVSLHDRHERGLGEGNGDRSRGGCDHGDETSGQIAAWGLAVANLTVVLSLFSRWGCRFVPMSPEMKSAVQSFNRLQKKYLRWFHYYLNPLFLGIVALHWSFSRCGSTSLPEWGFLVLIVAAALGLALKLDWCPGLLRPDVYKIHTHPVFLLLCLFVPLIGHLLLH